METISIQLLRPCLKGFYWLNKNVLHKACKHDKAILKLIFNIHVVGLREMDYVPIMVF